MLPEDIPGSLISLNGLPRLRHNSASSYATASAVQRSRPFLMHCHILATVLALFRQRALWSSEEEYYDPGCFS
jgi:hypothetical protein